MVKTVSELYQETRRTLLTQEEPDSATFYARNLLCRFTGKPLEWILSNGHMYVDEKVCQAIEQAVTRILAGEPLAYVLEEWDFYGMRLRVNKNVLIPRDDTCAVTDLAISHGLFLGSTPRILDLCTGSGCIGLAIAQRIHDAKVTLADISKDALSVAKSNVTQLKLTGRVACYQADALGQPDNFLGKFDMIVSNPPYITTQEMKELPNSVKDFEPHLALHGGEDGLIFYRNIADKYRHALKPGGLLCFEFGMGQGDDVCQILVEYGYTILERSRDYNDRERAVIARYDRKED